MEDQAPATQAVDWRVKTPVAAEDDGAPEADAGGDDQAGSKGKPDQVQALLRKLRNAEKERDALKQADEQRAQSQLSEVDKWKAKAQKHETETNSLLQQLRTERIQNRLEAAAAKAGAIDVDAVRKLADLSSVDIDDEGKVIGIDAVIAELKKSRKYLFGDPSQPVGNAGGNPPSGPPSTKVTEEQLRTMTSQQFADYQRSKRR